MAKSCDELREFLELLPAGEISKTAVLIKLLAGCWPNLSGSGHSSMRDYKLERAEAIKWNPPKLTFTIERHGGTTRGSTRAELQEWTVDLEREEATPAHAGHRQVQRRDKPLNVDPLVEEIVELIVSKADHPRLRWSADRTQVRLALTGFVTGNYKRTVGERRKRFQTRLEEKLKPHGWLKVPGQPNSYKLAIGSC